MEAELEMAELKMTRFSLRMTRMDGIKNGHIRALARVGSHGDKIRDIEMVQTDKEEG